MSVKPEVAGELATDLVHVVKKLSALRHHVPRVHPAVDTSAYPVLIALKQGPQRVSAIATCVHSDVSTVSRQVSHLAAAGVAEKVADPDDGRAQVVRLTPEGDQIIRELNDSRSAWFQEILTDWTNADASEFNSYLRRFDDCLTQELERLTAHGKDSE